MSTDTKTSNLIINKLTKAQYEAIANPSDTELYLTPDTSLQEGDDISKLTNDAGYIKLTSLSGTSPIAYNNATGVISVASGYQIPTTAQVTQISTNTGSIQTINTTLSGYGNIVTHNVSEFATASQGAKADSAVQNLSDLGITATASEINVLDGITATTTELNYIDGVTSNIQTQLNNKQATISDLTTIRSNATNGQSAYTTISGYGNIVTHNTSEFATSAQGAKADSALQQTDIVNNTTSTATNKVLSANAGKSLQDQLNNLLGRGKYLSIWDCTTGLAMDEPPVNPYTVETGSYFIVGKVGATNYRPNGGTYDKDVPSTTIETGTVKVNDTYYYDGTVWRLLDTPATSVAFSTIAGSPYDNTNLKNALDDKQATISDLATIRSNASNGQSAYTTISSYGNIVTHNTSEFATSSQGALADTALQPNDNISELTNDAGYITSSYHDATKQDTLVSGTNIKTINNETLLGSGNIDVSANWGAIAGDIEDQADLMGQTLSSYIKNNVTKTNQYNNAILAGDGVFLKWTAFTGNSNWGASTVEYSTDGITWGATNLPQAQSSTNYLIAYGDGHYVAIQTAYSTNQNNDKVFISENGISWTQKALPYATRTSAVAYYDGVFVITRVQSNMYFYSTDYGATWTEGTLPVSTSRDIGNTLFSCLNGFVVNGNGASAYSTNGTTWTSGSAISGISKFVAFAGSYLYKDNGNGTASYSSDGSAWTSFQLPGTSSSSANRRLVGVAYSVDTYAMLVLDFWYPKLYKSTDGINWTLVEELYHTDEDPNSYAYGTNALAGLQSDTQKFAFISSRQATDTNTLISFSFGGYIKGAIDNKISAHNTDNKAHADIRNLIKTKQDKLVSGTNIKTINNIPILGSGNINIQTEDEIFYVTYGVTTNTQMNEAFNAGKYLVLTYGDFRGPLVVKESDTDFTFCLFLMSPTQHYIYGVRCKNDVWTIQTIDIDAYQTITDNTLTTTAKTIVGAINEVNAKPSSPDLDGTTITLNSDNELQAIGTIDKNAGNAIYDWIGTLAQYESQNIETLHPEWLCFITDDSQGGGSDSVTFADIEGQPTDNEALASALSGKQNILIAGDNITLTTQTYKEVEYVNITDQKVIINNFDTTQDFTIEFKCTFTDYTDSDDQALLVSPIYQGIWIGFLYGNFVVRQYSGTDYISVTRPTQGTEVNIKVEYSQGIVKLYFDNVLQGQSSATFVNNPTTYLFTDGTTVAQLTFKECKITIGSNIIHDIIPAKANNIYSLFDLPLGNICAIETGSPFTGGVEVTPSRIPEGTIISALIPTKTSDLTNDSDYQTSSQVSSAISTHNSDSSAHSTLFNNKQDKSQTVNSLSSSGTISLTDNSINKITPSGTVTFNLPSGSTGNFHQILVQINMSTVQTINVGTTYFFDGTAPDLSKVGTYNLLYEYDTSASHWVCGAIVKGTAS